MKLEIYAYSLARNEWCKTLRQGEADCRILLDDHLSSQSSNEIVILIEVRFSYARLSPESMKCCCRKLDNSLTPPWLGQAAGGFLYRWIPGVHYFFMSASRCDFYAGILSMTASDFPAGKFTKD
jgi:hypothetical protein